MVRYYYITIIHTKKEKVTSENKMAFVILKDLLYFLFAVTFISRAVCFQISFSPSHISGTSKWIGRRFTTVQQTASVLREQNMLKMMPTCLVQSNVKIDPEEESAFLKEVSQVVASGLGKPESYVMVSSRFANMAFGGTDEPCSFIELISIGRIEKDLNKEMSAKISEVVEKHFGIPASRVYIQFFDAPRENFGFNGDTFA
mmetsp:Transcript_2819/g.4030  ORF Transcript_2819/g.4030 Transcript_2819/m.4030 type:complete len:201 (+) Transcript_2819:3-605(+)